MSEVQTLLVETLSQMDDVGKEIAQQLKMPACVHLSGDLGAGKTTLVKSMAMALGYDGVVTSPTYNLIHEYPTESAMLYHMDLYRLKDPEELEYLGIRDLYQNDSLFLIEWPERAKGALVKATHLINITVESTSQRVITLISHN